MVEIHETGLHIQGSKCCHRLIWAGPHDLDYTVESTLSHVDGKPLGNTRSISSWKEIPYDENLQKTLCLNTQEIPRFHHYNYYGSL
jgi:hypothetical protein